MKLPALFSRMIHSAGLVERMADTVGASEALSAHASRAVITRRAVSRCVGCSETQACQHWLDAHESADQAPDYCRNHDLFERLKRDIQSDMAAPA